MDTFETGLNLQNNVIAPNVCFLCGKTLDLKADKSLPHSLHPEHVIPAWAQRRYDLRDQVTTLRNGTDLAYRHAKVPSCRECNTDHLQQLETFIANAIDGGWDSISEVSDYAWYLWVGKITWGLHYMDCLLRRDLRDRDGQRLADPAESQDISIVRHLLQSVRWGREVWKRDVLAPCSVFVFRCQSVENPQHNWDLLNSLHPRVTGIRAGRVGVILAHRDESVIRQYFSNQLLPLRFMDLHPAQFREAFSAVVGFASHQTRQSYYKTFAERTDESALWDVSLVKAWKDSPRELFDDVLEGKRVQQVNHGYQYFPPEFSGHLFSVIFNEDGEYVPIRFSQIQSCFAGAVFHLPELINWDDLPDFEWMRISRKRYLQSKQ